MIPVSGQPNGQNAPLAAQNGSMGGVGGPSASPAGGTPKQMRRQRPPATFAGMQQQGVARPSPAVLQQQQLQAQQQAQAAAAQAQVAQPTVQSATQAAQQTVANSAPQPAAQPMPIQPQPGAPQASGEMSDMLRSQVMQMLQDPTQGLNEAAQSNFDRQNRVLGREFSTLREGLNENMAARGLDASTIAATKLGELGARQAEAQGDLAARIQEGLIRDRASAMQAAIQSAMGLRGQDAELDQMLWSRTDADRRFGLDSALGFGNLDIARGNLDLSRDRFAFDKDTDARNFNYRKDRDVIGDTQWQQRFDFDKSTDERDFNWRRDTDARDFNFRKDTDARDFGYQQDRDRIGDTRWQQTFDRDQTWRNEDNQYRDSRDAINDNRWQQGWDRDQTWRTEDQQYRDRRDQREDRNTDTGTMLSVLQGMGMNNIDPAALGPFLKQLGINLPDNMLSGGAGPRRTNESSGDYTNRRYNNDARFREGINNMAGSGNRLISRAGTTIRNRARGGA